MTLFEQLFDFVQCALDKEGYRYALAGGLASSFYRSELRVTNDLDLIVLSNNVEGLTSILECAGFKVTAIRQAQLDGGPHFAIKEKRSPIVILKAQRANYPALDLLLETLPWVLAAISRAEIATISFAGSEVPIITAEDLLVAKFYALERRHATRRYKDLDDVMDILSFRTDLDLAYIRGCLVRLQIKLPDEIETALPMIHSILKPN